MGFNMPCTKIDIQFAAEIPKRKFGAGKEERYF
jgi:hypothetical protein